MDNFKIEYLIGVAAFVAMIFHYQRDNVVLEVVVANSDSMGIFYISRGSCYIASVVFIIPNRGSRNNYFPLFVRAWRIPWTLYF